MSYAYTVAEFAVTTSSAVVPFTDAATKVDRSFGLPTALYGATIACYVGFLAIMMVAFPGDRMGLVIAICGIYLAMFFGVPAMWVRMQPTNASRAQSWSAFRNEGFATHTGMMSSRDAMVQVLILPVLILLWGVAIATMVAVIT